MDLSELNKLKSNKDSSKMPVLFLGHGSPMNAIEENEFVQGFRALATALPKPNSIICISAHWYTRGTYVTAMTEPRTIHDFGGFPPKLYQVKYPASGNRGLAIETKELINKTNVGLDENWGLDHGAWSVIKHLYPHADIPVIQLSIDYTRSAQFHFFLAKQIASLRNKGVLIIGSGNIIHNLGLVDFRNLDKDNYGFDWAFEAHEKFNKLITNNNFQELIEYEKLGTVGRLAIPTPDHYLPLIYALGLKEPNDNISIFNDKLLGGSLSMTSVKIDTAN